MITARLECIIKYINGNVVADIGTDHAYVPVKLIKDKRANKVIASDIRQGPVDAALRTVKKYNMEDKIEVRLGEGLSTISKTEADVIIIAGMGGELISSILEENIEIARNAQLILQPMNGQYELRKFLIENNFTIEEEDIAIEGFKVYNVLIVKNGEQAPFEKDIYYHLPKYLFGHKNYKKLFEKKKREFTKVVSGLENSKDCDFEKLNLYKSWLKAIEECKL